MKKLLRVHISVWMIIAVTIVLSIITTFLILNSRVESVMRATASSSSGGAHLQMKTNQVYKMSEGSQITIRLNDRYYIGVINKFTHVENKNLFDLEIDWKGTHPPILPSGSFDVEIIYKNDKVFHSLISPSV